MLFWALTYKSGGYMRLRVIINGANGQMGQEVVKAIEKEADFELVGKLTRKDHLATVIKETAANIVIDFTNANVAFENCATIIENNVHPVVGTTGFLPEQIAILKERCTQQKLGAVIAPNFSIGAILLMRSSMQIAHYFPHVEIIEFHHNRKVDAPSGTAIKTAEMIATAKAATQPLVNEKELLSGARGASKNDIHIHSVRLPGLVAHEEVIFGDVGQTLTLRHDTYHREAFMPGVILACRKVSQLNTLVYGLENLLD
jgi:4-hydroxy-tetrahydrodipicolinate reductase